MSDESLKYAIGLIKSGNVVAGRQTLVELIKVEPANELAWLWLAQTMNDDAERIGVLDQALSGFPTGARLLEARAILLERLEKDRPQQEAHLEQTQVDHHIEPRENPEPDPEIKAEERSPTKPKPMKKSKKAPHKKRRLRLWMVVGILILVTIFIMGGLVVRQLILIQQAIPALERTLIAETTFPDGYPTATVNAESTGSANGIGP